jgi:hypothetical protein
MSPMNVTTSSIKFESCSTDEPFEAPPGAVLVGVRVSGSLR